MWLNWQHVGIRGALNEWKDYEDDYEVGFVISHAEDLEDIGWQGVVQKIRDTVGNNPVYSVFAISGEVWRWKETDLFEQLHLTSM